MRITILKMDTPLSGSQMGGVPQIEPVLFAKALVKSVANYVKYLKVDLVGVVDELIYRDDFGEINAIHYEKIDQHSKLIIWQGSPIVNKYGQIKTINDFKGDVLKHFSRTEWHSIVNYNIIAHLGPKYTLVTDPKCPIIDTTAGALQNTTLLTQATDSKALLKHFKESQQLFGNKVVEQFSKIYHLPLYLLPVLCKVEKREKNKEAILSTQSLSYMTTDRLLETAWIINTNKLAEVDVLTNVDHDSAEKLDFLRHSCSNTKFNVLGSLSYIEAFEKLSEYKYSICPVSELYQNCGVVPNRFIEAVLMDTKPLHKLPVPEFSLNITNLYTNLINIFSKCEK